MGWRGGSKRGRLEAAKGRDNQGFSLTTPSALETSQGPFVPQALLELGQSFLLSDF